MCLPDGDARGFAALMFPEPKLRRSRADIT